MDDDDAGDDDFDIEGQDKKTIRDNAHKTIISQLSQANTETIKQKRSYY